MNNLWKKFARVSPNLGPSTVINIHHNIIQTLIHPNSTTQAHMPSEMIVQIVHKDHTVPYSTNSPQTSQCQYMRNKKSHAINSKLLPWC